jgi:hypothetical protein
MARVEGDPEPVVVWFVGGDLLVAAEQFCTKACPAARL